MLKQTKATKISENEVARRIEQAILDHRLPPGTKLKEVALADFFGVSRGLIRKVLSRLASSKLVEQTPNRGSRVASPSVQEGRDLFAARRAIESAVIDILVAKADRQLLSQLRKLVVAEQRAYRAQDPDVALEMSVDFHRQLAKAAGNRVLEEYLDDIIRRTPLVMLAHAGSDYENSCMNQEHQDIVDAIETGNAKRAKKLMCQHLEHIESHIQYRSQPETIELSDMLAVPVALS